MIHEFVRSFAIISIDCNNKSILSIGQSLPASICEPSISLTNQMHDLLKSGLIRHCIDSLATSPASCPYFQHFIGIFPSAPTVQRSAIVSRTSTTHKNVPRANGGRGFQRNNPTVVPNIAANETVCIKDTGRSNSIRLLFLVGGIML